MFSIAAHIKKLEHRRRLIDTFVNSIFLHEDRVVITFNYQRETKTITFADLEKSALGSGLTALAAPSAVSAPDYRGSTLLFFYNTARPVMNIGIKALMRKEENFGK